ncbi:MAG: hypothetical protein R6W06_01090, partial [Prochlorococcaceae cyanobacterium]
HHGKPLPRGEGEVDTGDHRVPVISHGSAAALDYRAHACSGCGRRDGTAPWTMSTAGTALHTRSGERAGRITSMLRLAEGPAAGAVIGLALVRRGSLAQDTLLAGEAGEAIALSVPAGFVPPPVGPGG